MSYHDILNIIIFNRVKIIKVTVLSTILIFVVLLFAYPVTYKATVTVLPPDQNDQMGGFSNLLNGSGFTSLLSGSISSANSQLYQEILKSRSAAVYVVKHKNLVEYYDAENIYEAAQELDKYLNVEVTKEGIIKLTSEATTSWFPIFSSRQDSTRFLAASISNTFVKALDEINQEKLSSKAKRARQYIEEQLETTKAHLDSAENALMEFQKKNKAVSLPEQLNASIEAAAKLKAEIVETEVELGLMKSNLKEDNKSLVALRQKLSQLNEQYNKMEMGSNDYLLAFKDVPELGKDLANLVREVKIQNEVYLLLQQQYYT